MRYEIDSYNALRLALESICTELEALRLSREIVFDSKLVVNELVSNVLQHGGGRAYIRVECAGEVRIAVRGDEDFRPPERSVCSGVDAERGRGLFLVDALTASRSYSREEGICVTIALTKSRD